MNLTEIGGSWLKVSPRLRDIELGGISHDSREVKPGDLFVAVPGDTVDGHEFISDAVKAGAVAIVGERRPSKWKSVRVPFIPVSDSRDALGRLSAAFYQYPSRTIEVCGVTGTKGKTTTSWFLFSIFEATGRRAGLFGTILNRVGEQILPSRNTTPSSLEMEQHLRSLADRGGSHAVMEVSSHGIDQDRISGIEFRCGVFTNLGSEHLDYHGTLENYRATKVRFFRELGPETAIVLPRGDATAQEIAAQVTGKVYWCSPTPEDDVESVDLRPDGISFEWKGQQMETSIWGEHNLWNLLLAITAADAMGIDHAAIGLGVDRAVAPPGRLEEVSCPLGFQVFVDYAHTDGALKTVLQGLRPITPGRLITTFGCGGDRDRQKRPRMGAAAERYSDKVVLTSDNPRSEDPGDIMDEITSGMERPFAAAMVPDRRDAIVLALRMAKPGDVVLIAGKGHEDYQEIRGRRYPFDDRRVVQEMIEVIAKEAVSGRGK